MAKQCKDSIILVTADYEHIDVDFDVLQDFPDLLGCLKRLHSFDERELNIFIKDDKKGLFQKLFNEYFGDEFFLIPKKETIEKIYLDMLSPIICFILCLAIF